MTGRLFDPGPPRQPTPRLSPDRRRTQQRRRQLEAGINPGSGRPLANNGETCGSCAHLRANSRARTYYKCGRFPITGGPATDIRLSWPACMLWEASK